MEVGSKEYRKIHKLLLMVKDREFEKIKFLDVSDRKRLEEIRVLEKDLQGDKYQKIKDFNTTVINVEDGLSRGFMSSGTSFDCYKRDLIVSIYIDNIIKKANDINDNKEKTNYIIDERYKVHNNVFDTNKENEAFKVEVSNYIADKLAIELNKINKSVDLELKQANNEPIVWNAQKNSIGTLFGILLKEGIISTAQANLNRMIVNNFVSKDNKILSKNSLTDNIQLKVNEEEGKTKYNKEIEKTARELIKQLKSETTKK